MKQEEIKFKLTGVAPLLMHNGSLADPFYEYTREIKKYSGKRKKTDEDFITMNELEFYGGLYVNKDKKLIIPSINIETCLWEGSKKDKNGQLFKSGVFIDEDSLLELDDKIDVNKLFENKEYVFNCGVRIKQNRVMRSRAIFRKWYIIVKVNYLTGVLDKSDIIKATEKAGELVGLGDWRPKFGRFMVELID